MIGERDVIERVVGVPIMTIAAVEIAPMTSLQLNALSDIFIPSGLLDLHD